MEVFWTLLAIAVMVGMAWLGLKIEPHWVSRDGRRFLCNAQLLDDHGNVMTRWQETRFAFLPRGELLVDQKRHMRHHSSVWRLTTEAPEPVGSRVVFVLRGRDRFDRPALMTIRLPRSSKAIATLREALAEVND